MDRATSPVIGVALLVALTVLAATAVGTAAVAFDPPTDTPVASFSLSVGAASDTLELRHRGGDTVDVASLRLRVRVDGDPLTHQPPVPFFAATGFESGPRGPFNSAASSSWSAGERATFRLAGTNAPLPDSGDQVSVQLVSDGRSIATVQAVAE